VPSAGITVDTDQEQRPEGSAPDPFDIGADEFVAAKYRVFLPLVVNNK
jgi:hypothetical protein